MKTLFVFYDGECGLCRKTRELLQRRAQTVRLAFLSYQDPAVQAAFPALRRLHPDREIIAMADTGEIYQGDSAWIVILWALRDYRGWAVRLARPAWRRQARKVVEAVARHRHGLSRRFGLAPD